MLSGVQSWNDLGGNSSRMESFPHHVDSDPDPGRVSRASLARGETPISTTVPRRKPTSSATTPPTAPIHLSTLGGNPNPPTLLQAGQSPSPANVPLYTTDPSDSYDKASFRRAPAKAEYGVSNLTGHGGVYQHQVPSQQPSHQSLSQPSSHHPGSQYFAKLGPNGRVPSILLHNPSNINQSHASHSRPASMTGVGSSWGSSWSKALEKPSSQVHKPVILGANSSNVTPTLASNTKALEESSYTPYNPSQQKRVSPNLGTNKEDTRKPSNELHKRSLMSAQVSYQQHARKVESGASTSVNPSQRASESVQSARNTSFPNQVQRAPNYPGQHPDQGRPLSHQTPRQGDSFEALQTPRFQDASERPMPVQRMNPTESVSRQTAYRTQKGDRQLLESFKSFQTPAKQQTVSFARGSTQLTGPTVKRQPTFGGIVEHSEASARASIVQPALSITRKPETSKNHTHNPTQPSSMVSSQQRDTQTAPSQREANHVKTTVPHESKLHHLKDLTEKKITGEFEHLKDVLKPNHNGAAPVAHSNGPSPRRASPPQSVAAGAISSM